MRPVKGSNWSAGRDIEIDPIVQLHYVEVREPDMHDPASDFRRLQEALALQWHVPDVTAPLSILPGRELRLCFILHCLRRVSKRR